MEKCGFMCGLSLRWQRHPTLKCSDKSAASDRKLLVTMWVHLLHYSLSLSLCLPALSAAKRWPFGKGKSQRNHHPVLFFLSVFLVICFPESFLLTLKFPIISSSKRSNNWRPFPLVICKQKGFLTSKKPNHVAFIWTNTHTHKLAQRRPSQNLVYGWTVYGQCA